VGAYKVYAGDCVASITVDAATWSNILSDFRNLDQKAYAQGFSNFFKDSFDFVLVVLDTGTAEPPAAYPYLGRYVSLATRTPRTRTMMGTLVLPYLGDTEAGNPVRNGPFLHELAHEWANHGVIPSPSEPGHWGFSSAGGQLGGYANLVRLGPALFQGYAPALCHSAETSAAAIAAQRIGCATDLKPFGTFANYGNNPKYSPLEKFVMGFLPTGQLPTTTTFPDAVSVNANEGTFAVNNIVQYEEAEIVARLGSRYVPSTSSQKSFRIATLVVTPNVTLSATRLEVLNRALTDFTTDGYPESYVTTYGSSGVNTGRIAFSNTFFTATDGVAKMRANNLYAERRTP
jgi:hypothetical protein